MILEDLDSVQPEELLAWLAVSWLAGCLNGCRQGPDGNPLHICHPSLKHRKWLHLETYFVLRGDGHLPHLPLILK